MLARIRLALDLLGPERVSQLLGFCTGAAVASVLGALLLYC